MRRSIAFIAATLAAGTARAGPPPPPPLTLEQARTMPVEELADTALRQIAREVRSVTRPDYDSLIFPDMPLTALNLALTPQTTAYEGLCSATVLYISFLAPLTEYPPRNAPMRAQDVQTYTRYKVIGDVDPYGLPPEGQARQQPRCLQQTQILPPVDRTVGHRAFFQFEGEVGPAYGVAILQRLLREVRNGTHRDYGCAERRNCTDAGAVLSGLSFDDLQYVSVRRSPADSTRYTVRGSFLVSGGLSMIVTDDVEVEAVVSDYPWTIQRVGSARVGRTSIIRD